MQNVSNKRKDSQAKRKDANVSKSVDNGEILTFDNERNRFALDQSKKR